VVPVVLTRKVLKPFTFSNGVTLPAGTHISAHLHGTHHSGSLYDRRGEFDGFRFIDEEIEAEEVVLKPRQAMHMTSKTYLAFGHGRHAWYVPALLSLMRRALTACFSPGRFFASMELKTMMAYLLINYDIKWPEGDVPSNLGATEQGYRPPDFWFNFNSVPNPHAHIMIRKRV
jgi:cytochrome P450